MKDGVLRLINAFEDGADNVRAVCLVSDSQETEGAWSILKISMKSGSVEVLETFEGVIRDFRSYEGKDVVLHGEDISVRQGKTWKKSTPKNGNYLKRTYSPDKNTDLVFDDSGYIYRSVKGGPWKLEKNPTGMEIQDMHASSPDRLFAAGKSSTVLQADGTKWKKVKVDVPYAFNAIYVEEDRYWVAGSDGVVAVFTEKGPTPLKTGLEGDILAISVFKGKTFISDENGIYQLDKEKFKPAVKAKGAYIATLNSGKAWLTANALNKVFQFDGTEWRGIEISFDSKFKAKKLKV